MIGVFGLSLYTNEKDLKELFTKYGPIKDVRVIYDHQTGRSRGFAFIYYEDTEDAIDVSCVWNREWESGVYSVAFVKDVYFQPNCV